MQCSAVGAWRGQPAGSWDGLLIQSYPSGYPFRIGVTPPSINSRRLMVGQRSPKPRMFVRFEPTVPNIKGKLSELVKELAWKASVR